MTAVLKTIAAAAALGIALTACDSTEANDSPTETRAGKQIVEGIRALGDDVAGPAGKQKAAPVEGVYQFGDTYVGTRGDITVSVPKPYTPSSTAATSRTDERWVIVTVTVTNKSRKVLDGYMWIHSATADGREAPQTYDRPGEPIDILPGQTGTWEVVFGIPTAATADVVVSVAPGMFEPIYWRGQA